MVEVSDENCIDSPFLLIPKGERKLKATVCELPNNWTETDMYWNKLNAHLELNQSDLLLLPEMPFYQWITRDQPADPARWQKAVDAHDRWIEKLGQLPVQTTLSSRPVIENHTHLNQGFVYTKESGYQAVHNKYYLPDEPGYYEASWYSRGDKTFEVIDINGVTFGFLICTELWFTVQAREYLKQGIDILVCPRATPQSRVDIWVTGGKAAAIVSGAFCLSSNFNGPNTEKENFGGTGWIIEPDRGDVLGLTSQEELFLTMEIDLNDARKAKALYPRYVAD
jgi:predicted amidohydrolase